MALQTIDDLTEAQLEELMFRKGLRSNHPTIDLENGTKYAIVLLKLHPTVVVPDDYPAIRTDIIGVTGVQDVTLLFDRQTQATPPPNRVQTLNARVNFNRRDDTPPA